jgi:hypothetical protein
MTGEPKNPAQADDEDDPIAPEIDALPPLDGGDSDLAVDEQVISLEGGADDGDESGSESRRDDAPSEEELRAFCEELGDFEEAIGDGGDGAVLDPGDDLSLEEDDAWGGDDGPPPLDGAWFDDEPDPGSPEEDGGDEGPLVEDEVELPEKPPDLEARYLGPVRGRVFGLAFVDGAPLAVGDGLYRLGADGLLHRYDAEDELAALTAAAAGDDVFLGTERRGLLRAKGFGQKLVPFNGWCASSRGASSGISVSFRAFAMATGGGTRLVGLTGEGHLFASDDLGRSWRGPIVDRRCTAAVPVEGEEALLAFAAHGDEVALLEISFDGSARRIPLPPKVAAAALGARVFVAAGGGVVAVAVDAPDSPLYTSIDRGARFAEIPAVTGVTAIAVDAHEPGWIAAAVHHPSKGASGVLTSCDGGATWRTAFALGRAEEREEPSEAGERVTALSVADGGALLAAITGDGVYTAKLPDRRAAH